MHVTVIEPPYPVITTAEAKLHLRVDTDDEDELIDGLIADATGWVDGPAGWLGRAVGEQTLEVTLDAFCSTIHLPSPPIVSVEAITYLDSDGIQQNLGAEVYGVIGREVYLRSGQSWPSLFSDRAAVTIQYRAGYPEGEVPGPIRRAILLLVGHFYANRESVVVGDSAIELPMAVEALLQPFRVWT